jgi:hypothetical protein
MSEADLAAFIDVLWWVIFSSCVLYLAIGLGNRIRVDETFHEEIIGKATMSTIWYWCKRIQDVSYTLVFACGVCMYTHGFDSASSAFVLFPMVHLGLRVSSHCAKF